MTDVHIVCRRPASVPVAEREGGALYSIINGIVASIADCEVTINGVAVENVESITWTVRGNDPARAVVTFIGATVDVDGIGVPARCDRCKFWRKSDTQSFGTCLAIREGGVGDDEPKAWPTGSVGACFPSEFETEPDFACSLFTEGSFPPTAT